MLINYSYTYLNKSIKSVSSLILNDQVTEREKVIKKIEWVIRSNWVGKNN